MPSIVPTMQTSSQPLPTLSSPAPIIGRKRRSDTDSQDAEPGFKRARVQFDSDVEVKFVDELGERTVALIGEEIRHAIRKHSRGEDEEYGNLKSLLEAPVDSEDAPSSNILRKHIIGLLNNVSLLGKSCADLVHAILACQWLAREDAVVDAYTRFLGNLVSSQPGYLSDVLKMLVDNFSHLSTSAGPRMAYADLQRTKLQDRLHTALRYVLEILPFASGVLASTINTCFPFADDTKKAHIDYVRNLLRLSDYAPEIKVEILDLIIERLIKIDVQVQIDVEDLEEDIDEMLAQGRLRRRLAHTLDEDEDDNSDAESVSSDDSIDEEEARMRTLQAAVEKLDGTMDLLFAHLSPSLTKTNLDGVGTFTMLQSQFRNTVLPTWRSRHTQFLLFHFAQTSPEWSQSFINTNLSILEDSSRSSIARVSAAAYIASFVARGRHIPYDVVNYTFNRLALFTDKLQTQHEAPASNCRGPDLRRYGPYYASVQALMYIFCFRWRALLDDPEAWTDADFASPDAADEVIPALEWASGAKDIFVNAATSRLNPLKVCAPEVVDEFARCAYHLRFAYVHHIIEQNKRVRLATTRSVTSSTDSLAGMHNSERFNQLDAYFPFDPYRLPLSRRWVEGDYVEWRGLPGENDGNVDLARDVSSVDTFDDEDEEEESETLMMQRIPTAEGAESEEDGEEGESDNEENEVDDVSGDDYDDDNEEDEGVDGDGGDDEM